MIGISSFILGDNVFADDLDSVLFEFEIVIKT